MACRRHRESPRSESRITATVADRSRMRAPIPVSRAVLRRHRRPYGRLAGFREPPPPLAARVCQCSVLSRVPPGGTHESVDFGSSGRLASCSANHRPLPVARAAGSRIDGIEGQQALTTRARRDEAGVFVISIGWGREARMRSNRTPFGGIQRHSEGTGFRAWESVSSRWRFRTAGSPSSARLGEGCPCSTIAIDL